MEKFVVQGADRENVTLRIRSGLLKEVDSIATNAGISRNDLITQMIEYAISNMEKPSGN